MSLHLSRSKPDNLVVKVWDNKMVHVGNYRITTSDFLEMAKYVLTNTNLADAQDPRIEFIEFVNKLDRVEGYADTSTPGPHVRLKEGATVAAAKTFPIIQHRDWKTAKPSPLHVPWSVAEKAYSVYAARHGLSQSLEDLARRGGFGIEEMDLYHPTWREEVSEIAALKAKLDAANRQIANLRNAAGRVAPQDMSDWESGLIAREDEEVQAALAAIRQLRAEVASLRASGHHVRTPSGWNLMHYYTRGTQGVVELVAAKTLDRTPTLVYWKKNGKQWFVYALSEETEGVEPVAFDEQDPDDEYGIPATPPAELLQAAEGRPADTHTAVLEALRTLTTYLRMGVSQSSPVWAAALDAATNVIAAAAGKTVPP